MPNEFSRRAAMLGAAVLPMVRAVDAQAQARPSRIVIASGNGVAACAKAMDILKSGGDTLDAVIAGVNIVELDPNDTSVGYGGLPNEEGVVELDASVMHGPSRRGGSVCSLRGIKTPSKVAKLVMTETDHMMLSGEGALRFAKAHGFKEEDLLTDRARMAWLAWKREMRDRNGHTNWESITDAPPKPAGNPRAELKRLFPDASDELIAWAFEVAIKPTTGTINCLSLNEKGEMSGVTTTSGMAWKSPGRVGDSPIIGGGLWVDQDWGAAGSTGRGEENLRVCGAHTCVENMRHGMSAKEAALDALKRVARNFENDEKRLAATDLQFYVLRKDGDYCGASLWDKPSVSARQAQRFAVCRDGGESHLENTVNLLSRK
jgi:N4-(beta-N-acetylglucosaminyl)-L-asparaginase